MVLVKQKHDGQHAPRELDSLLAEKSVVSVIAIRVNMSYINRKYTKLVDPYNCGHLFLPIPNVHFALQER